MAASVIATPPDAIKDSIARGVEARKEGINCNVKTNDGCDISEKCYCDHYSYGGTFCYCGDP
ncbi:hypothetical protein WAI453_012451 [Rhynchosporium graminicola]